MGEPVDHPLFPCALPESAEATDRIGYGIELSPTYCDVILSRWQRHTGEQPTRDGTPHDFGQPSTP